MNLHTFKWILLPLLLFGKGFLMSQSMEMKALHGRMVTCFENGDLNAAKLVQDSMEARLPLDSGSVALVVYARGSMALKNGNPTLGIALFEEAVGLAKRWNDDLAEGLALQKMGIQMRKMQGDSVARGYLRKALRAFEVVGYQRGIVSVKFEQAGARFRQGDVAGGDELLKEAFVVANDMGNAGFKAMLLKRKGTQLFRENKFRASTPFFLAALKQFEGEGLVLDQVRALNMVGATLFETGELGKAKAYFQRGVALADSVGHVQLGASCRVNLASSFKELGLQDSAMAVLVEAVERYRKVGYAQGESIALTNLAETYQAKGELDLAVLHQRESLAIDRLRKDSVGIALGVVNLGTIANLQGDWTIALGHFNEYEAVAKKKGRVGKEEAFHGGMAVCLEKLGRYQEALVHQKMTAPPLGSGIENLAPVAEQVLSHENESLKMQLEIARRAGDAQHFQILLGSLGLALLGALLLWIWSLWKKTKRELGQGEAKGRDMAQTIDLLNQKVKGLEGTLERKKQLLEKLSGTTASPATHRRSTMALVEQLKSNPDWAEAMVDFEILFPDFLGNLQSACPGLSPTDLRILTLLKLNLSSAEMAEILHITLSGVNKARQRVRKKVGLSSDKSFAHFLQQFLRSPN